MKVSAALLSTLAYGWQWQGGSNYGRIKASPHNKSSNKASNAFDSKGTTFWHSQGRNSWFEVNFTLKQKFEQLNFQKRAPCAGGDCEKRYNNVRVKLYNNGQEVKRWTTSTQTGENFARD